MRGLSFDGRKWLGTMELLAFLRVGRSAYCAFAAGASQATFDLAFEGQGQYSSHVIQ